MAGVVLLIKIATNFSGLPALIIGRQVRGILWYYAGISLISDISTYILRHWLGVRQGLVSNIFLLAEFLLVGNYLLSFILRRISWQARFCIFIIPAAIYAARAFQHLNRTNLQDAAVLLSLLIVLCLIALYEVMLRVEDARLEQSPYFTFAAAFLLYASGTLLLLLFDNDIRTYFSEEIGNRMWLMQNGFNILKNLAIARVLFIIKKTTVCRSTSKY